MHHFCQGEPSETQPNLPACFLNLGTVVAMRTCFLLYKWGMKQCIYSHHHAWTICQGTPGEISQELHFPPWRKGRKCLP